MAKVKATVHGAISLVNAIANQKGATLGIELKVEATVETITGKGITIHSKNKSLSSRLIIKTIEKIVLLDLDICTKTIHLFNKTWI